MNDNYIITWQHCENRHIICCSYRLTVKRWVSHVEQEQELHTPGAPEFTPVFSGVCPPRSLVLCVMFCRSLFVFLSFFCWPLCCLSLDLWLLITPLVSSDYPSGIFWLPLWYLLITPLVSSDYPSGIFWLPLWYLLITPLVSSDYPDGIFWLPLWYLLITPLVSSNLSWWFWKLKLIVSTISDILVNSLALSISCGIVPYLCIVVFFNATFI